MQRNPLLLQVLLLNPSAQEQGRFFRWSGLHVSSSQNNAKIEMENFWMYQVECRKKNVSRYSREKGIAITFLFLHPKKFLNSIDRHNMCLVTAYCVFTVFVLTTSLDF